MSKKKMVGFDGLFPCLDCQHAVACRDIPAVDQFAHVDHVNLFVQRRCWTDMPRDRQQFVTGLVLRGK